MAELNNEVVSHRMTPQQMAEFMECEKSKGASANMLRRYRAAIESVYSFLPEDKLLTKEVLLSWREQMEEKGYAPLTVQNYAKNFNRFLDFAGCSDIRFNRGRMKDIRGMEFGFLTAIEPTDKRNRKDVVWICRCRCGKIVELPATRLLTNNTLSCGCILKEHMRRANKYIDSTSLRQSLDETVVSTRNESGYVGVTKKRGKWQAQITYKRKHYNLGTYAKLEDAVRARARGKALVLDNAEELLAAYAETHKDEAPLPQKHTEPKQLTPKERRAKEYVPETVATRRDNTSGQTGVAFRKGKWEARIAYEGLRYMLGRFENIDDAIAARKQAEEDLKKNPEEFVKLYSEKYRVYKIKQS